MHHTFVFNGTVQKTEADGAVVVRLDDDFRHGVFTVKVSPDGDKVKVDGEKVTLTGKCWGPNNLGAWEAVMEDLRFGKVKFPFSPKSRAVRISDDLRIGDKPMDPAFIDELHRIDDQIKQEAKERDAAEGAGTPNRLWEPDKIREWMDRNGCDYDGRWGKDRLLEAYVAFQKEIRKPDIPENANIIDASDPEFDEPCGDEEEDGA